MKDQQHASFKKFYKVFTLLQPVMC